MRQGPAPHWAGLEGAVHQCTQGPGDNGAGCRAWGRGRPAGARKLGPDCADPTLNPVRRAARRPQTEENAGGITNQAELRGLSWKGLTDAFRERKKSDDA